MFCIFLYLINVFIAVALSMETSEKTIEVCLTAGCVEAAQSISMHMDQTVDPCDDFYHFACGSFVNETIIPDDKIFVDTFSIILDKVLDQLRTLINVPVNDSEIDPFKLVKKVYKSCMNTSLIQDRGIKPLVEIHETLKGWPILKGDKWNESSWSWQNASLTSSNLGYTTDYIFKLTVAADRLNNTNRIIYIEQPTLVLSRDILLKGLSNTIVQAYYSYQVDMAVLYGADKSCAEKEMKEVLEFEIALANISLPNEKRRNATALYNPMTIKDLQIKYPYNQWLEYFNVILPEKIQLKEDEIIIVSVISFFDELGKLLEKTPKRTMANYIMWRITGFSSYFLTENIRKRQLQYSTIIDGNQQQEPRWKECINIVNTYLPIAVGSLYVRKHFQKKSKTLVYEMVTRVKAEFKKILETVTWLDDKTRKSALKKLKYMATYIGYPDEILKDKKLIEFYKNAEIEESEHYLESILKINKFIANRSYYRLRDPVNKTNWFTHAKPADVNAHYSKSLNSIRFPAGILQGHFFSADRPNYINYGAIGFVIGHEITHGFDDQGRQFDLEGNLVDWWQEDTKVAYLEKAKCIIEQYGNFTEPNVDLPLNGINTQGENIADNGGIKEAYLAYKKLVEKNGQEPKLPSLNYSSSQLFWISAAQTWCSVYRPEVKRILIANDAHAPGQFRVLGTLTNSKEFSADFKCAIGTPMNPVQKCEVW
ncbi:unnamed protein product [Diamesa serratosioi]